MFSIKFLLLVVSIVFMLNSCGVDTSSSSSSDTPPDSNITDPGDDDDDDDDDDGDDDGDPTGSDNGFETNDAVFDAQACLIDDTYQAILDSSFDPLATVDDANGIEISSKYDYNADVELTEVAIFFPTLTQDKLDDSVNIYEDDYRFAFDKAWVGNANNTVYIREPKVGSDFYKCYRYELNSVEASAITSTKVYR